MRLLLGDPQLWKDVGDRLALDFQLSRQIVDSNLTHPLLFASELSSLDLHIALTVQLRLTFKL